MPDTIQSARLELVLMTGDWMEAVLAGEVARADAIGGFHVRDGWPDDHDANFLRMRLAQIREDPSNEQWYARAMMLISTREMIGHIGFHGPPRDDRSLELGYTVFPEHRRLGYAVEAAEALMTYARAEHTVRRFVLSVSPENAPSLGMAEKMGFKRCGEQWDEEDGLEWVFEKLTD
jgi:RimJ/RimL family protein N-acetyltransferase